MSYSLEGLVVNGPSILVDDSDAAIRYNGTWHEANETEIRSVVYERTPILNTLHVLNIFSGSFSYNFTGGGVSVYATPVDNSSYTAQCFVDGNQLDFDTNSMKPQFGQSRPVCLVFGLPDSVVHTIYVVVSVAPRNQAPKNGPLSGFSFDYLLIQPPFGVSAWDNGNQDIFLPVLDSQGTFQSDDTMVNFLIFLNQFEGQWIGNVSRGWLYDPENGFHTTTPGSQFNLTFMGTRLWWYGYINGYGETASSETFAIDGGAPSYSLSPFSFSPSQSYLFKTSILENSRHFLTVVFSGTNKSAPLTLQSLIIERSILDIVVPSSTSELMPSSSMSKLPGNTSQPTAKRGHLVGIAGGTAGGVILLLLVACGACMLTRWTHKRRQLKRTGERSTAATLEPFPIPVRATGGIVVPRKARASQDGIEHPGTQILRPPPLTKWSRLHTSILASLDHGPIPSSPANEESQPEPGPPVNPTVVADASRRSPMVTDTTHRRSEPEVADVLHPTTGNPFISSILSEREEEGSELRMGSVSGLPPAYTT